MLKRNSYKYSIILIILLALILRFYNFPSRWQIYADQARDAMVARGVLVNKQLPLIGSFSSAGPFVFGPLFYWFITACYILAPKILITPWIGITLVDICLVIVMIKIGNIISGRKLSLILGIFSAISTIQINRSSNLTQHTFVTIATSLTILFFCLYLKNKKYRYLFFMGLSMGIGISMHYQALNLLLYSLVIFSSKQTIKSFTFSIFYLALGLIIPSLPLLYWDFNQKWANINNILDYFLIGQYRIWVSNRWLTYITDFWLSLWRNTIGGTPIIGIIYMILSPIFIMLGFYKRKLSKIILLLSIIFFVQIILNRYYRGERFEGYLLYFHPLILLFSAWVVLKLIQYNRFIGYSFLLLTVIFTLNNDFLVIKQQNNPVEKIWRTIDFLKTRYPDNKFAIYDFYNLDPGFSQMLSLFLSFKKLTNEKTGIVLGVSQGPIKNHVPIYQTKLAKDFYVYELSQQLVTENKAWINVNPQYVSNDILYWWKKKPLKSYFSLSRYIHERIY